MAERILRVGLIGCGNIGLYHANVAALEPRLEMVAYADTRIEAAQSFLRNHGGRYATPDARELIADDAIDIVVIATHHDSHASLSVAAAAAGRHVLLEKPMAVSFDEALAIEAAVTSAGVNFAINYKFRLERAVRRARDFIPDPKLVLVQLAMPPIGRNSDDFWVYDPERGGGLVTATGTHLLDMLAWMARSEPVAVSSTAAVVADRPSALADITVGSVEFASGVIGSVVIADVGDNAVLSKWSCQVYDGVNSVVLNERLSQASYAGPRKPTEGHYSAAPTSMLSSLAAAVLDGVAPEATTRDGVRAVQLAEALAEAAARGGRVVLK